jgi:outer membrane protein
LKKNLAVLPALVMGFAVLANSQTPAPAPVAGPAPTKIGIISAAEAISATKEGQKAFEEFQKTVVQPKRDLLDKLQSTIQSDTDKLKKGAATLSPDAQKKLQSDIEANTKTLNRTNEDAQAEVEEQQGKIMQELGTKMMTVLSKFATDNGYAVILDVSSQQTPIMWAAAEVNITGEIVKLYDEKYPVAATPATTTAKPPATPPAAGGPSRLPRRQRRPRSNQSRERRQSRR